MPDAVIAATGDDWAEVYDRAAGAMLGLAVGDALGATVEFLTQSEIRTRYVVHRKMVGGGWLNLPPGHVTDDTEMSLCIARSLASGTWSLRDIADRFVDWFRAGPPDVGNTCRRGIARYMHQGTVCGQFNEGDAGNGAVMRVAPVALATLGDTSLLRERAVEQGRITHHHPLSDEACILVGRLIQLGCARHPLTHLRREVDQAVARVPRFRFLPYHGLATGYVVDTMQTVLFHFFASRSFEECLVATVNQGGDADTTGAIVGAIAGAYWGLSEIPSHWTRKMDRALVEELVTLARRLVDVSPLGKALAAA